MNHDEIERLRVKQEKWLFACLKRNAESLYGRTYGFDDIDTVQGYQIQVPLVNYEDIAAFITRIAEGEDDLLFTGAPVAFEVTGGSSSGGKLIPYTQESFSDFQRAVLPWFMQVADHYGVGSKASYWSISPALRASEKVSRGMEIGVNDAAYLGEEAGSALANALALPQWVGELSDLHDWQLATLYWLICSEELELISVWSPTFLLMLLEAVDERQEVVGVLLREGGIVDGHCLAPNMAAYERLQRYLQERNTQLLWPDLKLISCWEDAMSKPFAKRLRVLFPYVAFQPKGLISTEGVVTMPDREGYPLLSAESGFYEFIDAEGSVLLADVLVVGEIYEVVMTTSGGLYRYRSGDMVQCEGVRGALPILRFMGRRGITSDMVGEKLNEAFVQHVLKDVEGFAMLVPQSQGMPKYLLIGEDIKTKERAEYIEERLLKNPQYAYARKIGQLAPLEAVVVESVMMHYIAYKTASGSRIGDIKVPVLQTDDAWQRIVERECR